MLLTFCMATLIGIWNRLEPDTIVLRALTAAFAMGVFARIASDWILAGRAERTRGGGSR